jgi:hypothetical protein
LENETDAADVVKLIPLALLLRWTLIYRPRMMGMMVDDYAALVE